MDFLENYFPHRSFTLHSNFVTFAVQFLYISVSIIVVRERFDFPSYSFNLSKTASKKPIVLVYFSQKLNAISLKFRWYLLILIFTIIPVREVFKKQSFNNPNCHIYRYC